MAKESLTLATAPQRPIGFADASDCYALGMVIYETISGNLPFYEHADLTVFTKVMAGKHPDREAGFPRHLWKMLERCWTSHPDKRPSIGDVLRRLRGA